MKNYGVMGLNVVWKLGAELILALNDLRPGKTHECWLNGLA